MNAEALNDCNKRHLAQLAKEKGITGWHAMRKDQLIRALSSSRSAAPSQAQEEEGIEGRGLTPKEASVCRRRRHAAKPRLHRRHPRRHWTTLARKTGSSS